jgi:hypothetical protein
MLDGNSDHYMDFDGSRLCLHLTFSMFVSNHEVLADLSNVLLRVSKCIHNIFNEKVGHLSIRVNMRAWMGGQRFVIKTFPNVYRCFCGGAISTLHITVKHKHTSTDISAFFFCSSQATKGARLVSNAVLV